MDASLIGNVVRAARAAEKERDLYIAQMPHVVSAFGTADHMSQRAFVDLAEDRRDQGQWTRSTGWTSHDDAGLLAQTERNGANVNPAEQWLSVKNAVSPREPLVAKQRISVVAEASPREAVQRQRIDTLFDAYDTDGNDLLDFEEFKTFFERIVLPIRVAVEGWSDAEIQGPSTEELRQEFDQFCPEGMTRQLFSQMIKGLPGDAISAMDGMQDQVADVESRRENLGVAVKHGQCIREDDTVQCSAAAGEEEARRMEEVRNFLRAEGFADISAPRRRLMTTSFPIHAAVQRCNAEMVASLLWARADPMVRGPKGLTPAQLARKNNQRGSHQEVLEVLENHETTEWLSTHPEPGLKPQVGLSTRSDPWAMPGARARAGGA